MNRRIIHMKNAVSAELERHGAAIEADESISKIQLTVTLGRRSGVPERVSYSAVTDTRLTEGRSLVGMRKIVPVS
jgi:hypothetical protein